jgi:DNA-binding MarR family transcriptional regulator
MADHPELGRLLRRAARYANRAYRSPISDLQLGPRQAAAILALVEAPGMSLGALAETLGADQPTTSALVDRLLTAELVRRETDPTDRRRARLEPTDEAVRLAERVATARRESEELLWDALGPEDGEELARILNRLTERLGRAPAAPTGEGRV